VPQNALPPSVIDGGDGNDTFYIRLDASDNEIQVWRNAAITGEPTYAWDAEWPEGIPINGKGGEDTLILDFTYGDVLPRGGLVYDGGEGSDSLIVTGTHSDDSIAINASQLVFHGSPASYLSTESVSLAANPGENVVLASLELSGLARVSLAGTGHVALLTGNLSIMDDGTLDLGQHDLIVRANPQTRDQVFARVVSLIEAAHAHWVGTGITSHAAAANAFTGLAAVLNDKGGTDGPMFTQFTGEEVGVNDILVKYTWNGDANLDGVVNADDYFQVDSGFITQAKGYQNGDFNYDGIINADDYFLIDSAFIGQSGPLAASKPQSAVSADVAVQQKAKKADPDSILSQLFSTEPVR